MTDKVRFSSPVGRIVQGDPYVANEKDQQGNVRTIKSGPNMGQPNPQYFVAVAFAKNSPDWAAFCAIIYGEAQKHWPALFPAGTPQQSIFGIMATPCVNPLFAFKIKDGDGVDRYGKSNASKPGHAGHWIVSFASSYPPKVSKAENGTWVAVDYAKRGHFVQISGSIESNKSTNTPGLFLNLDLVAWRAYGEEIVGGPNFDDAFAAAPAALPAGASSVPLAAAALPAGATPPPPGGAAPPPPAAAAPPPPPAAAAPPPAPAPAGPVMLPAAGATTYDGYKQAGWTDEQLIAQGYMQAPTTPPPANTSFMDPGASTAAAPPPPPSAPPAMASPTKTMTAAAGGATYESFIAQGWTDEQLISSGYMTV